MDKPPYPERGRASRLLIVDDDPLIRLLACERLGAEGFEIAEAGSGEEGIEVFGEVRPDLMLLDVEMPGLDGYAVCSAIRGSASGRHVPILILTGRDDVDGGCFDAKRQFNVGQGGSRVP